jgi:hypothetical protein
MKKYNCFIIVGNELKEVTIIADICNPDSTCATRFYEKTKVIGLYGTPESSFELVAQYPSDRFIIESIEDMEKID